MERNNPKTINEKQKNYMQDKVLVLIDGCFKCDSSDENVEINIQLIQHHPAGAIAGLCRDEYEIISQINFNKSEGSFVIGGILNERSCPSRSQTENEAKLKPLKYSHKIRIRVEHNCSVKPKTSETVEALKYHQVWFKTAIDLTQLENNIFEAFLNNKNFKKF
uniref:Uncharacterized protein n=1 Tax=Meloidogyne enterolobii TaxID=390850 RepID=A0A6V7U7C2_MELEN|nr:unnamed protein product [Meloidogyne enterolobii]